MGWIYGLFLCAESSLSLIGQNRSNKQLIHLCIHMQLWWESSSGINHIPVLELHTEPQVDPIVFVYRVKMTFALDKDVT